MKQKIQQVVTISMLFKAVYNLVSMDMELFGKRLKWFIYILIGYGLKYGVYTRKESFQ